MSVTISLAGLLRISVACEAITELAIDPENTATAIEVLTLLNDRRYSTGSKKRNHIIYILNEALKRLFSNIPDLMTGAIIGECIPSDRL